MTKQRTPYLLPPEYDIDALLNVDRAARFVAFKIVNALWEAIDLPKSEGYTYFRPDSTLLPPEVTLRDFCLFDTSMGNGWATSLGYSGGLLTFFRGLRALRTIGHRRGTAMAETVLAELKQYGIPELTTFADDPIYGCCDDWDLEALNKYNWDVEQSIDEHVGPKGLDLDSQWWAVSHSYWDKHGSLTPDDPEVRYTLCEYIDQNRLFLQCRKPKNVA